MSIIPPLSVINPTTLTLPPASGCFNLQNYYSADNQSLYDLAAQLSRHHRLAAWAIEGFELIRHELSDVRIDDGGGFTLAPNGCRLRLSELYFEHKTAKLELAARLRRQADTLSEGV